MKTIIEGTEVARVATLKGNKNKSKYYHKADAYK